jgi:hypothetical protein
MTREIEHCQGIIQKKRAGKFQYYSMPLFAVNDGYCLKYSSIKICDDEKVVALFPGVFYLRFFAGANQYLF